MLQGAVRACYRFLVTRCTSRAVLSHVMTDEWCVDLSALPRFPSGFAETYYASKTQSQRHQERSYKFATESYVCLPTMKTKRCAGLVLLVCCYLYVLLSLRRSSLMVPRMNYILKLTEPSMVPHANRSFEKSVARAAATRVFRFTSCAFLILCNKYLAHGSCLFK